MAYSSAFHWPRGTKIIHIWMLMANLPQQQARHHVVLGYFLQDPRERCALAEVGLAWILALENRWRTSRVILESLSDSFGTRQPIACCQSKRPILISNAFDSLSSWSCSDNLAADTLRRSIVKSYVMLYKDGQLNFYCSGVGPG